MMRTKDEEEALVYQVVELRAKSEERGSHEVG